MNRVFQSLSLIACCVPFAHFVGFGLLATLGAGRSPSRIFDVIGTIRVAGLPLPVWMLASLIAIFVAFKAPPNQQNLKHACLAFPILATILIYTVGEYVGP